MYCHACGTPTSQLTRYCNRCGSQLTATVEDSPAKTAREKRLDEYLDGLFWITVFGLAFVFGGMVILKKINLSNWLILGYIFLSSVAFLINFGLSLWRVAQIHREGKTDHTLAPAPNTGELSASIDISALPPIPSVTENTTRSFDPVYVKRKTE
jgi:hypothetical protein